MFPLIAVIAGLVLGLMASPNPIVAIICGGMLGLIAWALTGFKVNSTSPAESSNNATQKLASESTKNQKIPSVFSIEGHGEVTPHQFGATFVLQSSQMSEVLLDMLFGPGKPGRLLPLNFPVGNEPLAARLFLTAMLIASYFVYPVKFLAINDETKNQIMAGVVAELAKLRKPDGLLVGREDIDLVRGFISSFYDFIVIDIDQSGNIDSEHRTPLSKPPKATELLISIIVSHYNGGGAASQLAIAKLAQQGFYHPSYAAATEIIDDAAHIPHKALASSNVKITKSLE